MSRGDTTGEPAMTLVLLSFRRHAQTTGPCLASLLAQPMEAAVELVLVDNASDDGSAELCAAFADAHPAVRWLPQARNLGFGGGMNAGAAAATADWIVLVNSDTLFPPGALAALQRTLAGAPPRVAMLGPVSNAAGNGQHLGLPGFGLDEAVAVGAAAMRQPTGLLVPSYRTDFFCVAVRRAVWQALGGLDPAFGLGYYEDFDFSLRLRAAGHEQCIAEDVFIVHAGSASFSTLGPTQRELLARNRRLMLQRHPEVRFDHRRQGNAEALQHLLARAESGGWSEGLRARAAWRLAELEAELPRSPFKRWRWRRAVRPLQVRCAAAGIAPRHPDVPAAAALPSPPSKEFRP